MDLSIIITLFCIFAGIVLLASFCFMALNKERPEKDEMLTPDTIMERMRFVPINDHLKLMLEVYSRYSPSHVIDVIAEKEGAECRHYITPANENEGAVLIVIWNGIEYAYTQKIHPGNRFCWIITNIKEAIMEFVLAISNRMKGLRAFFFRKSITNLLKEFNFHLDAEDIRYPVAVYS